MGVKIKCLWGKDECEMITIYTESTPSCDHTLQYFRDNKIEFIERKAKVSPLTFEEFIEVLKNTLDGVAEIISIRSDCFKGVEIDNLTLSEFYQLYVENVSLLKYPLIFDGQNHKVQSGYEIDNFTKFLPRKAKKKNQRKKSFV